MSTKIEYIVGVHLYCFRPGDPAQILDSVLYSSDNLSNRPCLHVIFSDGVEDYIPISDLDNYRILKTEEKNE